MENNVAIPKGNQNGNSLFSKIPLLEIHLKILKY